MATKKKTAAKKSTPKAAAKQRYVIARCSGAGVHAGYLVSTDAHHTVLRDARRIWYWTGAASLSEIAVHGINPSKLSQCKIAAPVKSLRLRDGDIHELLECHAEGEASVTGAPVWRA